MSPALPGGSWNIAPAGIRLSSARQQIAGAPMSLEPKGFGRGENPSRNVFGDPLQTCSLAPKTGFFRNGCCDTGPEDVGSHTVCVEVTEEFLQFSKLRGNDLSTPQPDF